MIPVHGHIADKSVWGKVMKIRPEQNVIQVKRSKDDVHDKHAGSTSNPTLSSCCGAITAIKTRNQRDKQDKLAQKHQRCLKTEE